MPGPRSLFDRSCCVWLLLGALLFGCGADSRDFLVVVESSLYEPLQASLDQYAEAMQAEGFEVHVEPWSPGTVDHLKALLSTKGPWKNVPERRSRTLSRITGPTILFRD